MLMLNETVYVAIAILVHLEEKGFAQGSVVGPTMFLIFMNDLELIFRDLNCHFVNSADDTNLLLRPVGLEQML